MLVTEAGKLMCPFMNSDTTGGRNSVQLNLCVTTECMAWRKTEIVNKEKKVSKFGQYDYTFSDVDGYCKLIDK